MNWKIPDRSTWYRVEARSGTRFMDRDRWCKVNCEQRWIQPTGSKITEFESSRDATMFMLVWG